MNMKLFFVEDPFNGVEKYNKVTASKVQGRAKSAISGFISSYLSGIYHPSIRYHLGHLTPAFCNLENAGRSTCS